MRAAAPRAGDRCEPGLGGVKLLGGLFGHSLALVADAVHSLVDSAISAALLLAFIFAERPADREHPYGHGRIEALAGAGVALLLIGLATAVVYKSLATISVGSGRPAGFALLIAGGSSFAGTALPLRERSGPPRRCAALVPRRCWQPPGITASMPWVELPCSSAWRWRNGLAGTGPTIWLRS